MRKKTESKGARHRRELLERQTTKLDQYLYGDSRSILICPLCLKAREGKYLYEPENLSVEHAPPAQYNRGVERCLTCHDCNHDAGDRYETQVGRLNTRRQEALRVAHPESWMSPSGLVIPSGRLATPLPAAEALLLATVTSDERKLELKSAYLIAFATLGYSYILGAGLATVRSMLVESADLAATPVCAAAHGFPPGKVLIALDPIECVIVSHPTGHDHSGATHVVFLPLPQSGPDFYDRIRAVSVLPPKHRWTTLDDYDVPPARRLPMYWDEPSGHPFEALDTWALDCACHPPDRYHEPIEIRLSEHKGRALDLPGSR